MTETVALRHATSLVFSELHQLKNQVGGWRDPAQRIAFLEEVASVLERMIRERNEAYR